MGKQLRLLPYLLLICLSLLSLSCQPEEVDEASLVAVNDYIETSKITIQGCLCVNREDREPIAITRFLKFLDSADLQFRLQPSIADNLLELAPVSREYSLLR